MSIMMVADSQQSRGVTRHDSRIGTLKPSPAHGLLPHG